METSTKQSVWVTRGWQALAAVTAILYILQAWSPLRLQNGTMSYLTMAENGLAGKGFVNYLEPWLQPGFGMVLAGAMKVGLGVPWFFVVINLFFMCLGLAACYSLYRTSFEFSPRDSVALCLLIALSFTFVKHVTVTFSDMTFFGIAMCCLVLMQQASRQRDWRFLLWLLAAGILGVVGLFTRSVGATLMVAWGWVVLDRFLSRRLAVIVFVVSLLIAGLVASKSQYAEQEADMLHRAGTHAWTVIPLQRLYESGELLVNTSRFKAPGPLQILFVPLGAGLLLIVAAALWRRRSVWTAFDSYGVVYLGVLSFWWANESRFWIPVTPLLLAWVWYWLLSLPQGALLKMARNAYVAWFILMGLAALLYSTRVTFSGRDFPNVYGGGAISDTYRAAWGMPPPADPAKVDQIRLRLLQAYDPQPPK
jgi:hypothetical protein